MSNRNVWINEPYIYGATTSGVNIYSSISENKVAEVVYPTGINAVWADDSYLYMATTNSGVLRLPVSTISGTYNVTPNIVGYKNYPNITNNNVGYLHGADEFLCATTISGVDHFNTVSGTRIYTTVVSNPTKCFQISKGYFYYVDSNLHVMYDNSSNWTSPDYTYVKGDIILSATISDLFVIENTPNVLLIATTNGAAVIEEKKNDEGNSRFKYYFREAA